MTAINCGEGVRRDAWTMHTLLLHGMLLAGSLVFALGLGEATVRVMWPQELGTWIYTRDGLTIHFSNMTQYSHKFGHYIVTNSAGMRDREHALEKRDGLFRVLVLGDSFIEANQVRFEDSFVSLLERQLLEKTGQEIEVISGSVSGWGTDDELTYLMREGIKYKPDLVLVAMTIHNDINDNLMEEYHTFINGKLDQKPIVLVPGPSYALLKVKEWLNAHSHLYKMSFQAFQARWSAEQGKSLESHVGGLLRKVPSDRIRLGWDMTEQLFKKLVEIARNSDAKVVVVMLPLSVQIYTESLDNFLTANGLRQEDIDLLKPQETMAEMGRRLGFPLVDLLPIFRSTKEQCRCELFVPNDGHWNEKGHVIAANLTSDQLLNLQLVPRNEMGKSSFTSSTLGPVISVNGGS